MDDSPLTFIAQIRFYRLNRRSPVFVQPVSECGTAAVHVDLLLTAAPQAAFTPLEELSSQNITQKRNAAAGKT